jgi:hypothetical protein
MRLIALTHADRRLGVTAFSRWTVQRLAGHRGFSLMGIRPSETPVRTKVLKPVTNQVTTPPVNGRQSATALDTDVCLTCGGPTQPDTIGRNRHAW